MKKVETALQFLSRHSDYCLKPERYFARLQEEIKMFEDFHLHHPGLLKKARQVENEVHKIKGFIRFTPVHDILVGTYKSKHVIMDLIAMHFSKRYSLYRTVTWNEEIKVGCLCLSIKDDINQFEFNLPGSYLVSSIFSKRMYQSPELYFFRLPKEHAFSRDFLPVLLKQLHLKYTPNDDLGYKRENFDDYWNAFYDSQNIESRTNYKYAMRNFTKKQLLKQLGVNSIEAQRVYKKVKKDQKTLFDF